MGRPKTRFPDLPRYITARVGKNGGVRYYYGQNKIALGSDLGMAIKKRDRLFSGLVSVDDAMGCGDPAFLTVEEVISQARPYRKQVGIYFLILGKSLIYVGQTTDIWNRLQQHRLNGREFDSFFWVPCEIEDLNRLERFFIKKFLPLQNSHFQGRKREKLGTKLGTEIPPEEVTT